MLVAGFLAVLAELGVGSSAAFYLASSGPRVAAVISTSLALAAVVAASTYVLVVPLLLAEAGRVFPGVPEAPLLIAAASVVIGVPTAVARQVGLAAGSLAIHNKSSLLQAVLLLALMGLGALMGVNGATAFSVLYLASLVITGLATLFWLRKQYLPRIQPSSSLLMPIVKYGLRAHVGALGLFLAYRLDILIVNYLVGTTAAGLYAIALTLSELLRGLPETAQAVVMVRFRQDDFVAGATAAARLAAAATLVAGVALASTATWLVPFVFGWRYEASSDAFVFLVPGVVGLAYSYSLSPILLRAGEVTVSAGGAICATAVMVALDFALIPRFGIQGAAIGSSVAYLTLASIQIKRLMDRGDIRLAELCPRPSEAWRAFATRGEGSGGGRLGP
jgi:O-antigen/teichoic acid export membrane protein